MNAEYGYCEGCGKPLVRDEKKLGRYSMETGKEIVRYTVHCPTVEMTHYLPLEILFSKHTIYSYNSEND